MQRPLLMPDSIPNALKSYIQWVNWKWGQKPNGKYTKVPIRGENFKDASSTNPEDWDTYHSVQYNYHNYPSKVAGIGFVFTDDDPFVGIDLDDCYDAETGIKQPELGWVERLNSYTEVSPSGKGVKIIFRGSIPSVFTRRTFGGNGIYETGRFFTITGNVLPPYTEIREVSNYALTELMTEWFPLNHRQDIGEWEEAPERLTDAEVIEKASRASNGEKFEDLLRGDYEAAGFSSQSEADMSFIALAAFYTGYAPLQLDRLYRNSGLMRDKWDEQRGSATYGERTIKYVLDGQENFWTPDTHAEAAVLTSNLGMPPSRQELRNRWRKAMEGYPAPALGELPKHLRDVVRHLQPLGLAFREDWLEMSALGFLSALFYGKKFENLNLNVWTLGIAGQSTGKSVVADELDELIRGIAEYGAAPRLTRYTSGSAAGLIRRLQGANTPVLGYFSEWSGFAKSMEAEHSSNMREVLMDLYDGRSVVHQLASETIVVDRPHLVLNGLTTKASWTNTARTLDMSNGLYSRSMFIAPDTEAGARFRAHKDDIARGRLIESVGNHFNNCFDGWHSACFDTPDDLEPPVFVEYMESFLTQRGVVDMDALIPLSAQENIPSGRLFARVKKIAAILEMLEERPQIRAGFLRVRESNTRLAIRIVQRGAAYAMRAFGWLARSRDDEEASRVLQAIEQFRAVSLGQVLQMTALNVNEAERAVRLLENEALISSGIQDGKRVYYKRG